MRPEGPRSRQPYIFTPSLVRFLHVPSHSEYYGLYCPDLCSLSLPTFFYYYFKHIFLKKFGLFMLFRIFFNTFLLIPASLIKKFPFFTNFVSGNLMYYYTTKPLMGQSEKDTHSWMNQKLEGVLLYYFTEFISIRFRFWPKIGWRERERTLAALILKDINPSLWVTVATTRLRWWLELTLT